MTNKRDFNSDAQFLSERIEELFENFYFRSITQAKINACISKFMSEHMQGTVVSDRDYVKKKAIDIVKAHINRINKLLS